ncbi:hypothetical protein [Emticicia agri]|uniref:Right handed beta helix domain-containing protein n=1 Tax=Emticicia agri TaxID=2492393 RepID=A0A4Q5LU65_9BACT|nr:hypothetical protein [Emticicia agri]RYU93009.1 hypothetical protein EWM59_24330 [Emticicia agri]
MKKISLLFVLFLCSFAYISNAQTVRRVNKTPGLNDPAIYTSVQAAINASAPSGDIIYIEPTDVDAGNYGDITIDRQVTIIGTGYELASAPNTSFDKRQVSLGTVYFENGSAGSTIMGLIANYVYFLDINCIVTRCLITQSVLMGQSSILVGGLRSFGHNATVTNSRVQSGIDGSGGTNWIISNNILSSGISNLTGAVINYNTFYFPHDGLLANIDGSTVTNNIFDGRGLAVGPMVMAATSNGTTVSNNLCTNIAGLPTGGGNVNSANPNFIFMVTNPWSPYVNESNFQLSASSPAKTVGPGSTPIGAFAGNNPYILSGVPNVPVITSFFNTGSGTTATPLSVTISVRSAN